MVFGSIFTQNVKILLSSIQHIALFLCDNTICCYKKTCHRKPYEGCSGNASINTQSKYKKSLQSYRSGGTDLYRASALHG